MKETIVSKQNMEGLKTLSEITLKISDAKNLLFKLQEDETEYLILREKRAMERIQKVIDDSGEMVKEADKNYEKIQELFNGISEFASNLVSIQEQFTSLFSAFNERNVLWEADMAKQQDEILDIRNKIKVDQIKIENDSKSIDIAKQKIKDDQRKLDSDRGTVERAIIRLKENRI